MEILFKSYSFIFGALIGSFLNVLIYRIPREQDFIKKRSTCEKCRKPIYWYENIPILSYIFLRGRCSKCKTVISWRHPFIEIIVGFFSLYLFPLNPNLMSLSIYLFYFAIFCALIVHFFIDIDFKILPDSINIYLGILFFIFSFFKNPWQHWLYGGLAGFGITYGITWIFYKIKGQIGLGGGDIKLYAVLGFYLGVQGIILNIFLSSFLGSLIGLLLIASKKMTRDTAMPFGPFIIIVAMFQIFWPEYFEQLRYYFFKF